MVLVQDRLLADLFFNSGANSFAQFFFQLVAAPTAARLGQDIHFVVGKFGNPHLHVTYALFVDPGGIDLFAPGELDGERHKQVRVYRLTNKLSFSYRIPWWVHLCGINRTETE